MKKYFFLLLFFVCVVDSSAQRMPPVPPTTGAFTPSSSGLTKISNWAKQLAEVVCFAGEYAQNKYMPINLKLNQKVVAMWFKVTAGCTPGGANQYSIDSTPPNDYQAWGIASASSMTKYRGYCVNSDGGHVPGYDDGVWRVAVDGESSVCFGTWYPPPAHPILLGRGVQNRQFIDGGLGDLPAPYDYGGNHYTSCCQVDGQSCIRTTWCTLVKENDIAVVLSTAEFSNLYLPNPYNLNYKDIQSGTAWSAYSGYSVPTLPSVDNTTGQSYDDYLSHGYFPLADGDVTTYLIEVNTSTSIYYSSTTVNINIDLSTTNAILEGIRGYTGHIDSNTSETNIWLSSISSQLNNLSFGLSTSTILTSTAQYWGEWTNFSNQYSSMAVSLFSPLIPTSSDTWRPCFDMSGLWSGFWSGSRPSGKSSEICLSDFSGWNTFMNLIRAMFMLIFAFYGMYGIWQTISEARLPGLANSAEFGLSMAALVVLAAAVLGFSYFVYSYLSSSLVELINSLAVYTPTGTILQMMNYCGMTQALSMFLSLLQARWNILLFLNFWGAIRK